jgi:plastocyanin
MFRTAVCLALTALGCTAAAAEKASSGSGGVVRGRIRWVGPVPPLPASSIPEEHAACGKTAANERLRIGPANGVKDAVVWIDAIEDAPGGKPVTATVDQKGCVFLPHVQVVPAGSKVDLVNSDAMLHNVHAFLDGERSLFNIAMPPGKGQRIKTRPLAQPGIVDLRCDAGHSWMSAWIHVAAHPWYTVTAEDGSYSIEDVPPGDWVLRVWHEGWRLVRDDPPTFSDPILLEREIQVRTSTPAFADFDLRDF